MPWTNTAGRRRVPRLEEIARCTRCNFTVFMKTKRRDLINRAAAKAPDISGRESEFREVIDLIRGARQRALQAVNASLVALYWEVGRYISQKEREFYLRLAHREAWDKRETDRQLRGALFERAVLGRPKVSPAVTLLHPDAEAIFKD